MKAKWSLSPGMGTSQERDPGFSSLVACTVVTTGARVNPGEIMPYEYSEGQKRWLRKHFASEKDMDRCCDCPGCDKCTGFVTNCKCDQDLSFLEERRNQNGHP